MIIRKFGSKTVDECRLLYMSVKSFLLCLFRYQFSLERPIFSLGSFLIFVHKLISVGEVCWKLCIFKEKIAGGWSILDSRVVSRFPVILRSFVC